MTLRTTSEVGQKLIAAIVEAAEEFPDRIVTHCVYFDDEIPEGELTKEICPSCIVGEGLARSGLVTDFEAFIEIPSPANERDTINSNTFDDWCFNVDFLEGITRQEVEWILEAQKNQDKDRTWEHSVREADLMYGKEIGRGK